MDNAFRSLHPQELWGPRPVSFMAMHDLQTSVNPPGTGVSRDLLNVISQQRWILAGSVAACLVIAGLYCLLAPKLYRAETMILVEDQKVPENYVKGVDEGNLEQRIFVIQKQVRTHAVLADIVKEFNLYPELKTEGSIEAATSELASIITVEMLAKGPRGNFVGRSSLDAFIISYVHEDPRTAMLVTQRVATRFIDENLKAREQAAQGTTEFFDDEVQQTKRELEQKEDALSQFKSRHAGQLPQQIEANLRALDRLQNDLKTNHENIQRLSDRLALLEKHIGEYQRSGTTNPALVAGAIEPDPLIRRLKELREKLVKLRAEFWEEYPDVILTRDELREVERKLVELYGADILKKGEKLLDPYLQDLRKQKNEVADELALLKQRQQSLQAERRDYQARVEQAPQIEQDLLILERDYDNMKSNYRSLLDRRLSARVAENLEKRQKGAQFRILESASLPRTPVSPNARRIMVFSLIFGCAIGGGLAMLREHLFPQFRRPEDVEEVLGPQLLGVIPDFHPEGLPSGWRRYLLADRSTESTPPEAPLAGDPAESNHSSEPAGVSVDTDDDNFVVRDMPNSLVAEQYRVAAMRLTVQRIKGASTVLAVTSAVKGEGKTTTVLNLGYTLARDLGHQTVIVDCDFAAPMSNRYLDTMSKWGLADCLVTDIHVSECLTYFPDARCAIMPVGDSLVPPSELLRSGRLPDIVAQLRQRFDFVLLNTPPILPMATMNLLASLVDEVVLVVRANSTSQHIVRSALKSLRAKIPVHIILNRVGKHAVPQYSYRYPYRKQLIGQDRERS